MEYLWRVRIKPAKTGKCVGLIQISWKGNRHEFSQNVLPSAGNEVLHTGFIVCQYRICNMILNTVGVSVAYNYKSGNNRMKLLT
jgi:hypothetical protein